MHIVSPEDTLGRILKSFQNGDIDREQMQALSDTAAVEAGIACERCHVRAPSAIIDGKKLCDPCRLTITRTQR